MRIQGRYSSRFFTTKPLGKGLGFSVAYGIIKEHKGTIEAESRLDEGSTFTIKSPIRTKDASGVDENNPSRISEGAYVK